MARLKVGDRVDVPEARPAQPPARSPDRARRWTVVNVETGREAVADQGIAKLGYVVYVPRFSNKQRDKRKHRAWHHVLRPLFPGYLFVKLSPDLDPWIGIEAVRGVVSVVKAGDKPGRVPDLLIEKLRDAEPKNFKAFRNVGDDLVEGTRLRVTEGPFADQVVRFVSAVGDMDSDARIVALLDLFGRASRIELAADHVVRD
jgi:transcriptional antiterminator RfaH